MRWWLAACLGVGLASSLPAQETAMSPFPIPVGTAASTNTLALQPLPDADDLLQGVIARLPRDTVRLAGRLTAEQGPDGHPISVGIGIIFSATNDVLQATYVLYDNFGRPTEQFAITRRTGRPPEYLYSTGMPPSSVQVPNLYATVPGTEISWLDLTFDFLWWQGGRTLGREEVRGQTCCVVDLQVPEPGHDRYSRMRLWVDERVGLLLQAEGYDAAGGLIRRVTVKSLKKVRNRWMVKDVEMRCFPSNRKTFLRVDDMDIDGEETDPAPAHQ